MHHNHETGRKFSESLHSNGRWSTHISLTRNPLVRAVWNFLSFKRHGVSTLARLCHPSEMGLEIGCGKGAYAYWFTGQQRCTIIAVDWSFSALSAMPPEPARAVHRVCADAHMLPFKAQSFDFFFTIDVFGHLTNGDQALDEALRIMKPKRPFFFHSECNDYTRRWPDKHLIRALGADWLAELDGHWGLRSSAVLYKALISRFTVHSFFSPAGLAGWLLGYPEKYGRASRKASWRILAALTAVFAFLKKNPLTGVPLRFANILSNHIELFLGIVGGGSCFAHGTTPDAADDFPSGDDADTKPSV
jgi:SAM-dependent methyltransferase